MRAPPEIKRRFERWMYSYGYLVAGHPKIFIAVPLLFTILSAIWIYRLRMHRDVWELYTPADLLTDVEEAATYNNPIFSSKGFYRVSRC